MKLARLPPVGNPVSFSALFHQRRKRVGALLGITNIYYYASGTQSLGVLLNELAKQSTGKTEVIIPAYTCPDVVSAIYFANLSPVLVDMQKDKPRIERTKLREKLNDRTLAVIGINFLGIKEHFNAIRNELEQHSVVLIEDSAQRSPWRGEGEIGGDYAVVSFGRGKPESVLHGGAVLVSTTTAREVSLPVLEGNSDWLVNVKYIIKLWLYNRLISPKMFGLVTRLPFLSVGETRYKPMVDVQGMMPLARKVLDWRLEAKVSSSAGNYLHEALSEGGLKGVVDLPGVCDVSDYDFLLRYPILLPTEDAKKHFLKRAEYLGVSPMYPSVLGALPGLELLGAENQFPNATKFCQRLVTLPCHQAVTREVVEQLMRALKSVVDG